MEILLNWNQKWVGALLWDSISHSAAHTRQLNKYTVNKSSLHSLTATAADSYGTAWKEMECKNNIMYFMYIRYPIFPHQIQKDFSCTGFIRPNWIISLKVEKNNTQTIKSKKDETTATKNNNPDDSDVDGAINVSSKIKTVS